MSKELMDIVLPRLAQRLNRQLRRYRAGELDDAQFSRKFESLLQQQYSWLANQGIPEVEAAVAVHGGGGRGRRLPFPLGRRVVRNFSIRFIATMEGNGRVSRQSWQLATPRRSRCRQVPRQQRPR